MTSSKVVRAERFAIPPYIMAPAIGSRKGKKAWRKNINTRQVMTATVFHLLTFISAKSLLSYLVFLLSARRRHCPAAEGRAARDRTADVSRQQSVLCRQGTGHCGSAATAVMLLSFSLLPLQAGDGNIASAVSKCLSRKRKQLAQPLRCELIAGVHKPTLRNPAQSGSKARNKLVLPHQRKQPQLQLQQKHQGKGVYKLPASSTFDLWDEQPDTTDPRLDKHNNIPGAINGTADQPSKRRMQAVKPASKAVEVDAAGCSYNPDVEHHQEALSQAVATEMQKVYKHDMQPRSVPRFVDYQPETDELALLQVDAEPDSDEDDAGPSSPLPQTAAAPAAAFSRTKQTKKDEASKMRRRLLVVEEKKKRALKAQRRDIDNLRQLQLQVQTEEAARYCCLCLTLCTFCSASLPAVSSHREIELLDRFSGIQCFQCCMCLLSLLSALQERCAPSALPSYMLHGSMKVHHPDA